MLPYVFMFFFAIIVKNKFADKLAYEERTNEEPVEGDENPELKETQNYF